LKNTYSGADYLKIINSKEFQDLSLFAATVGGMGFTYYYNIFSPYTVMALYNIFGKISQTHEKILEIDRLTKNQKKNMQSK